MYKQFNWLQNISVGICKTERLHYVTIAFLAWLKCKGCLKKAPQSWCITELIFLRSGLCPALLYNCQYPKHVHGNYLIMWSCRKPGGALWQPDRQGNTQPDEVQGPSSFFAHIKRIFARWQAHNAKNRQHGVTMQSVGSPHGITELHPHWQLYCQSEEQGLCLCQFQTGVMAKLQIIGMTFMSLSLHCWESAEYLPWVAMMSEL